MTLNPDKFTLTVPFLVTMQINTISSNFNSTCSVIVEKQLTDNFLDLSILSEASYYNPSATIRMEAI